MKSSKLNEKKTKFIRKSEGIKYLMLASAVPIGLILSCGLTYYIIDFSALFKKSFFDLEIFDELLKVMRKWGSISFTSAMLFVVLILGMTFIDNRKPTEKDVLTWKKTIFLMICLILVTQFVFPVFFGIIGLIIALLYLIFFLADILKPTAGYLTYLFAGIVEKLGLYPETISNYNVDIDLIKPEEYTRFLTMIIFYVSIPYFLPLLLWLAKKIILRISDNKLVELLFELSEKCIKINILRYFIYILLFFVSVFSYRLNIPQTHSVIFLLKEPLLDFVLLDTVIYSIISNILSKKQKQGMRKYISFKYDLEFVLSAITIHNLKNKEIYACIKFSEDINKSIKTRNQKDLGEIESLLVDISENYYSMEELEKKIKKVLSKIIDSTE